MTPPVSRGFRGRGREAADAGRVPPGQYVTPDFPVLSAGPTPHQPKETWSFEIRGEVDEPRSWTWEQLTALPSERIKVDIHCVTKWSKLDTSWTGVSLDTLLDTLDTSAEYVLAFCDGGYTSNLPLEDVRDGKAWKSAKWVRGIELREDDTSGFWEGYGYHNYGDPWKEQRYAGD